MRFVVLIPLPLILLGAIVLNGLTDDDKALVKPESIDTATIKKQVDFGNRARKAEHFDWAIEYCEKGADNADIEVQMSALTCLMWAHRDKKEIDKALEYAYRLKSWDESQGFGDQYIADDIVKLEKLRK
jgi:hypothetical protein